MMGRRAIRTLIAAAAAAVAVPAYAERWPSCGAGAAGSPGSIAFRDHCTVAIENDGDACRAIVTSGTGKAVLDVRDTTFSLDPISGKDVDKDDGFEVVLRSDSPAGHRYRIVACGDEGTPVVEWTTRFPGRFEKEKYDLWSFAVPDDAFLDFPDFRGANDGGALLPIARILYQDGAWHDAGARNKAAYDAQIRTLLDSLSPADLRRLKAGRSGSEPGDLGAKVRVLRVVMAYVYSGREKAAWDMLARNWPEDDIERVKKAILERHGRGVLRGVAP